MSEYIPRIYEKITNNLRGIAFKKGLAAKIITKANFPIRAGLWVIGPDFSRNYAVPSLPPPLDKVKRWGGWRKGKILKMFMRISEAIIYPWLAYANNHSNSQIVADVVLLNRLNEPVGFDLKERKVIKSMSGQEIRLFEISVSHLTKIYRCVPFQIDRETGYIFESMISGSAFSVINEELRFFCVSKFFEGLKSAPICSLDTEAISCWRVACAKLVPLVPGSEINHCAIFNNVSEIIARAKTSWVHGDLFGENIIMATDGPVVIDYDKSGVAPTFTDIMTLFVFEARTLRFDLIDAFFKGVFDHEFYAIGCQLGGDDRFIKKVSLFISWLGWKAKTEKFSSINMIRFFEVLERYLGKRA